MKEQFIPYELAKELVSLGFDEKCFDVYSDVKSRICYMPRKRTPKILWQQAFRFFGRKYNLYSYIELVLGGFDYVIYVDKSPEDCEDYGDGPFVQYDQAQEACLRRLIKEAKND
mgnify:CR=1 FL=1